MNCAYLRKGAPDAECDNECLLRSDFKNCDYTGSGWERCKRVPDLSFEEILKELEEI